MHDVACEFACAVRMRRNNWREPPQGSQIRLKNRTVLDSTETTLVLGPKQLFQIYSVELKMLKPFWTFI